MRKHWFQIVSLGAVAILFVACGERSVESGSYAEPAKPISSDRDAASAMNSVLHAEPQIETNAPTETQTKDQLATLVHDLTGKNLSDGKTTWSDTGKPTETVFPDGSRILFSAGRPKEWINAGGLKASYDYNAEGQLNQKLDSAGNVERFNYGANGELVSKIDKDGRVIPLKNGR